MKRAQTPRQLQSLLEAKSKTQRDIAKVTGAPLSLVCYVCKGLAHFEKVEQLMAVCTLLDCKPADIYKPQELRLYYPDTQFERKAPARVRDKYGNPSVRVRSDLVERIKNLDEDVNVFVNTAVEERLSGNKEE